jgi:hypothetical protein
MTPIRQLFRDEEHIAAGALTDREALIDAHAKSSFRKDALVTLSGFKILPLTASCLIRVSQND